MPELCTAPSPKNGELRRCVLRRAVALGEPIADVARCRLARPCYAVVLEDVPRLWRWDTGVRATDA